MSKDIQPQFLQSVLNKVAEGGEEMGLRPKTPPIIHTPLWFPDM